MTKHEFVQLISRYVELERSGAPVLFLESQLQGHPSSRYSLFAAGSKVLLTSRGDRITLVVDGRSSERTGDPWKVMRQVRTEYPGWYFGYFGYDLKNHIEELTSANEDLAGTPDLLFFRPEHLFLHDQQTEDLTVVAGDVEHFAKYGSNDVRQKAPGDIHLGQFRSITGENKYLNQIRTAQELIREGEFYEINLSHALTGSVAGRGFDLFRKMRQKGPVPFAAYLQWNDIAVCSASPERFLKRDGNRIYSQPIKGTAARAGNRKDDEERKFELIHSEKERAENLMIVDLVRHDLSKVALPGTVRVPELFELQSFETVHQLISTVEGDVHPETDSVEIVKACFPMGSMTGAPKIRAMKAIEELEDYKRGIYSGAIGYFRPDHNFDFNVVIRSAILTGGRLIYPVGGAITSGSVPEKELEETYVKARALTEVLNLGEKVK